MSDKRLATLFLATLAALSACYQPSYAGPYACDPAQAGADCPDGWSCVGMLCAPPGASPDMGTQGLCAGRGTLLAYARGGQVWACAGSFPAGGYAALCASSPGVHVCGANASDDFLLSLLECDTMSGFYLAQASLAVALNMATLIFSAQCEAPPGMWTQAILGCGLAADVIQFASPTCHSLHDALQCPASGGWSCSAQSGIADVAYSGPADSPAGVLCCSDGSG